MALTDCYSLRVVANEVNVLVCMFQLHRGLVIILYGVPCIGTNEAIQTSSLHLITSEYSWEDFARETFREMYNFVSTKTACE